MADTRQQHEQHGRIMVYANGNLLANCEECGVPCPVELTRCADCDWTDDSSADGYGELRAEQRFGLDR